LVLRRPSFHGTGGDRHHGNPDAIAETVCGLAGVEGLGLLSYDQAAGAKCRVAGMEFKQDYDETREVRVGLAPFERRQGAPRAA
jgi:hypothetical protein